MHMYNAWLPAPVGEETKREKESFTGVVKSVKNSWTPPSDDVEGHESVYHTLKWISVIDLFIKAKSEIGLEDVGELVEFGLEVFHASHNRLYAQVRWGNILVKLLNKYGKKLSLKLQWRPFYDCLVNTHFTRNTGPEGWRLRQRHFETLTSLVRSCRKFFSTGSAFEIWSEFRSLLENPWHNSSFEGAGDWIRQCIDQWNLIPNCQFWDSQWAAVISRCIKNYHFIDWETFLPVLFTRYLNMFEWNMVEFFLIVENDAQLIIGELPVPVANSHASYPFTVDVPGNTRFLFSNKAVTPEKSIAKSIVYLLKPGSSSQEYFEKLVNLLEQFYHPSNGGRWTYSLERFLRYLVITFQKRLQHEQLNIDDKKCAELFLGKSERTSFVEVVLKLINRGQYSKNDSLAETVATATSILSYVEPSLVLPFVESRFHMALETTTATHQLTTAVMSVAFSGRVFFLASVSSSFETENLGSANGFIDLLMIALSNALLGMDANDPPKTLATMQLIGSIFSNMSALDEDVDGQSLLHGIRFSEWLDEFLCRLFSLLQHLESSSVLSEGLHSSATSGTFLVEDGFEKISKFVKSNILPGAIAEVGLLCCACVHSNPEEAAVHLVEPILISIISSLKGLPVTGFGGSGTFDDSISTKSKPTISPALEAAVDYQLKILSVAISYGGPVLLHYRDQLKEAIISAFDAPSWKKNGSAQSIAEWRAYAYSKWHIPNEEELSFANELLSLHLCSALDDLLRICQTRNSSDPGSEKEHLKVTLLRIDSSLQGVLSCLPDFRPSFRDGSMENLVQNAFFIAGATGSRVGSSEMREKAADVIHEACKYLLEERSDDSILLILIIRIIDSLANFGSLEYDEWSNHKQAWKLESPAIIEPPINYVVQSHSRGKKRPRWALIDKAYMHNTWRSSQSSYHLFRSSGNISPSNRVHVLMDDLLNLSLHRYETVRALAGKSLLKMLKRWPCMISKCVLTLTDNLQNQDSAEHALLGSCAILATQTVIKRLTTDLKALSSFLLGVLASSHHESLKSQKAITELFVKYNIHFAGVSRNIFRMSDGPDFVELVSQIGSMSVDRTGLHWRKIIFVFLAQRLVQECGLTVLLELQSSLEEFSNAKERSKQCVAAEALAGVMHSDINGLSGAWDSWICAQLQNIIQAPLVESTPEWIACIRYAVTGKGKYGTKVPLLRQRIMECLATPLPQTVATNVVSKRYAFLSAALLEISSPRMPLLEVQFHDRLLKEVLDNMRHTSAQVREAVGVSLTVLCSNIRLYESFTHDHSDEELAYKVDNTLGRGRWDQLLTDQACELAKSIQKMCASESSELQGERTQNGLLSDETQEDVKWMETMFHFVISSLKSGRSQFLLDIIVGLLYPVISLKETSNKDLSTLAKAAFELLKWKIFPEPHLRKAVSVLLSLANDSNWRTRFATLTYLRTFVYRHTFIFSREEKLQIWETMEKLLVDNQVEVREHAAAVLAGLMKGGDEVSAADFRDRAFTEALSIQKKRTKRRSSDSIPMVHGAVLALAASVLSVPYDMPR
ncbi:hypothetical protein IFM89_029561 [Coptis chinensis]|uniref:Proteasome activator Blm10 middle HEAT repeats region domain-containing protein n=1 Tax=Coptis chinensis TaxID=261450 RepID=A0A835LCY7_9MAGN|nr:hypothetical protein IFM89_029561 [Coptis chinensis]